MSLENSSATLLMHPDEVMTLKEAAYRACRSVDATRRIVRQHNIYRQMGLKGRLEVSAIGLEMVLHGDLEALRLLKAGHRSHVRVALYLLHLGLAA
jgi:hypothetical protein